MTMCVTNTPVEDHVAQIGLLVKREDLCCPPGPHFSKCRGVWRHVASRPEKIIGVLDTSHSQGGWAVAQACKALGKECVVYWPVYKHGNNIPREQQREAANLGALLIGIPAGRSAILYHRAKKDVERNGGYMMPNALKLPETVDETAREYLVMLEQLKQMREEPDPPDTVIVSASSGTIAAGLARVHKGLLVVHMGYSRPEHSVLGYIFNMSGGNHRCQIEVVDEGYAYNDQAVAGFSPDWPCNSYYDLKAFRWWTRQGMQRLERYGLTLFWNVG